MKILVVDHNAIDPVSQVLYRAIALEGGVDVRLVVPDTWHDNYRTLRGQAEKDGDRFEVLPLRVFFHSRTHRLIYRGLGRQLRDYRPDILYVNAEPENFQTIQCAMACAGYPDIRFVFSTWRNISYDHGRFPYQFAALHAMAERHVLRRADHGVAFVPEAPGIFSRLGFNRLTWVPPEIDTTLFKPLEAAERRTPGGMTVGYAGRLQKLKGVDVLLRAIARLPADFRLVVVGAGPDEHHLRALCNSLGLDLRVQWHPPVARRDMPAVLTAMDVLVLPSRTGRQWKEQFGRVLVEAMACGVPVIGSNSGSIPHVIGTAGQVVAEGDVDGLSGAIARLRTDSLLREQCVRSGLDRVRTEYDVPVIAARFLSLLRSLGS